MVDVEVTETPSARSRLHWLVHNTGAWVGALLLLVVAMIVGTASLSAFTSTSASAGNVVATGSLAIDDDIDNGAIFTADGLVPGDTVNGAVTIQNTGESSGRFTLEQTDLVDLPGPNGGELSAVLRLSILTDGAATVYDGGFAEMPTIDLGTWGAGESHSFSFLVEFPDSDLDPTSTVDDDDYQLSSVSVTFLWAAVSG